MQVHERPPNDGWYKSLPRSSVFLGSLFLETDHRATAGIYPRSKQALDMTAIEDELNEWSRRLHPVRIDLVGDYAGQELFFIEGDSLLRVVFGDGRIDMDGMCVSYRV